MHVPCVVIDRLDAADRKIVRTELRRAIISAYEVEGKIIAITGRIEAVRSICQQQARIIGSFRCRKQMVDGEELNQAHDAPGQFKDLTANKISRFEGLDRRAAFRLCEAFRANQIEAGIVDYSDGSRVVFAEFPPLRKREVDAILADVTKTGYQYIESSRGNQ